MVTQRRPFSTSPCPKSLAEKILLAMFTCLVPLFQPHNDGILDHSYKMNNCNGKYFQSIVQVVSSEQNMGGAIRVGEFTLEAADAIVAQLSQGRNQYSWGELANKAWHDSAIRRFLGSGPLKNDEMTRLAKAGGDQSLEGNAKSITDDMFNLQVDNPWIESKISNVSKIDLPPDIFKRVSTATFTVRKTVKGTGTIEASMWTLVFLCEFPKACDAGYMVPLVVTRHMAHDQSKPASSHLTTSSLTAVKEESQFSYSTLWLGATSTMLINAIPFFITSSTPTPHPIPMMPNDQLAMDFNVHENIPSCPAKPGYFIYRSHLEASYGLLPATTCAVFTSGSFRLLVTLGQPWKDVSVLRDYGNSRDTTAMLLKIVGVENWEWRSQPFEECLADPLLVFQDASEYVSMCLEDVCVDSYKNLTASNLTCTDNYNSGRQGLNFLYFLQLVAKLSNHCIDSLSGNLTVPSLDANRAQINRTVKCQIQNDVYCSGQVSIYKLDKEKLYLISRRSNWTSSKGRDTSEFKDAPRQRNKLSTICSRIVSPNCSQSAFHDNVQIHARTSLESFMWAHTMTFTRDQGPATDLKGFLALLLSTAVSVFFGFAGPAFTKFVLRNACRRWPQLFNSDRRQQASVRVFMFALCNLVLSLLSFLPVLYMACSERDREKPFKTWDLQSGEMYDDHSELRLRIISLLLANSKYKSHFISISVAMTIIVCLIVFGSTVWHIMRFLETCSQLRRLGMEEAGVPLMALEVTGLERMRLAEAVDDVIASTTKPSAGAAPPPLPCPPRFIDRRWTWSPARPDQIFARIMYRDTRSLKAR